MALPRRDSRNQLILAFCGFCRENRFDQNLTVTKQHVEDHLPWLVNFHPCRNRFDRRKPCNDCEQPNSLSKRWKLAWYSLDPNSASSEMSLRILGDYLWGLLWCISRMLHIRLRDLRSFLDRDPQWQHLRPHLHRRDFKSRAFKASMWFRAYAHDERPEVIPEIREAAALNSPNVLTQWFIFVCLMSHLDVRQVDYLKHLELRYSEISQFTGQIPGVDYP